MTDTELGVGLSHPLFFIGVVENNNDPQLEGRVKVRAFSVHGTNEQVPTTELPWAICAAGNYDPNNPPPPLNSFVYGMFIDGRAAQQPLVLGLIPSQNATRIDPRKGWGVIPGEDGDLQARGATPRDFGQPQNSRLMRGENIEETYVLDQEINRREKLKVGGTDKTWSEPSAAYNTKYPYNRVIETAHHAIELDDTPGGERIMIHHKEGGYIQIDSAGVMTQKSSDDQYNVTSGKKHEHAGNGHVVTIHGDAHVYVKGNKTEEIEGDYKQIVRGNVLLGCGGQFNINASEQIQARAADVKVEANVGTLSLKAAKEIQIGSDIDITMTAQKFYHTAYNSYEVYSTTALKFTSVVDTHFTGSNMYINMNGALPPITPAPPFVVGQPGAVPSPTLTSPGFNLLSGTATNIKTGGALSIDTLGISTIKSGGAMQIQAGLAMDISVGAAMNIKSTGVMKLGASSMDLYATTVNVDNLVNLGSGDASAPSITPTVPTPPAIAVISVPGFPTSGTQLPEPPAKSTQLDIVNPRGSKSGGGYTSPDSGVE